ncbi:clostripain-related cysteine peptidase [Portibacter lacus]|uniref:Clostripain n=1 Tax=Portibacter lacus TaxID=1099794 RepID=A0AA37SQ62_9BACT|nr:clostripain-related cysteine peptidase [Portibacter lacus]GLR18002.1 clostripain [Portibacter lacus]
MKKLIFTLLTLMFLCGMTAKITAQDTLDWTLLVYLVGSDLESGSDAGSTDIQEMMDADFTDYVNVIVLRGGSMKEGWQEPKTFLVVAGEQIQLDFVPSNTDMADPNNITEFINWATENYPAHQFMMDFWNHGGDIRGYGNDEVSGKSLKVQTIKKAIGDSEFIKDGNLFELLGFDACLMATLEVQTSLKDFANYFVGSEETEPGHGWNYTPIVNAMESGEALTGDKLGTIIVDSYKAQSEDQETSNVTLGVMNLAHISNLESKITTLFNKIKDEDKVRSLQKARGKAEEYSKSIKNPEYSEDMVDIGDMMKMLKKVDPSLSAEIDSVLVALDSTVVYNKKDSTRPLATGISMYLPHNVLIDEGETYYLIDSVYIPIGVDSTLSDFIVNTYIPLASSDITPPSGMTDPDFTFSGKKGESATRNFTGDSISAIRIAHDDDLEQVQIVLIEEFEGFPNEYIFLGATFPDTIVSNDDGTETYAYKWDGAWLGINGYPAYISDIQDYEVEDEDGNFQYHTRVHIPAILHPDTENERDIIISYSYDEDFNITLESIVPEVYGDSVRIVPKERLELVPGDVVQLLYESFNEVTDEEFFVVDDGAVFTIENGNDDLMLEYDELFEGNYKLGYILMDHSQNDTIIFDDKVFTVTSTSVEETFADHNIAMFPNPANQQITIENIEVSANESYKIRIFDQAGRLVFTRVSNSDRAVINTSDFTNGYYRVQIISGKGILGQGIVIQH